MRGLLGDWAGDLSVKDKMVAWKKRGATFYYDSENLRGVDLEGVDLRNGTYVRTDFRDANLKGCDFRESNLNMVKLEGANLEGAGTWATNLNSCMNHPICN